ncbi:MAG: extensin family protein [Gammaproteobacteria bacterium]
MNSGHASIHAIKALCTCIMLMAGTASLHSQQPPAPVPDSAAGQVPLPERNPARLAPPLHPSQIAVPDWTAQEIQEAMDQCSMMLADTGVVYRHIEPLREGRCGTPAPIELSAIGANPSVAVTPPAQVTCGLATSLSAWSDSILQKAARTHLDDTITGIRNVASYVCRNRYNASDKRISEHARANALDMAAFKTQSGTWITVLDLWALPPEERIAPPAQSESAVALSSADNKTNISAKPAPESDAGVPATVEMPEFKPESAFLHEIHTGACTLFGTVLGPEANEAHKDHFHYDLAERRNANYCE